MMMKCRLGMLFLCFAAMLGTGCTTSSRPSKTERESEVQKVLARDQGRFQLCGKHLKREGQKQIEVNMTFRLNPSGALETLWLDESGAWDSRFYDCLFNVVDGMSFPAFQDESTLEVQQVLLFRARS